MSKLSNSTGDWHVTTLLWWPLVPAPLLVTEMPAGKLWPGLGPLYSQSVTLKLLCNRNKQTALTADQFTQYNFSVQQKLFWAWHNWVDTWLLAPKGLADAGKQVGLKTHQRNITRFRMVKKWFPQNTFFSGSFTRRAFIMVYYTIKLVLEYQFDLQNPLKQPKMWIFEK